jgi:formate dehydrogenase iron-sulfur subunit
MKGRGGITQDENTALPLPHENRIKPAVFDEIRKACPYDIPRINLKTATMAFCTLCFDRIKEGLLPACVKACPTHAINFGDRNAIIEMANKRLSEEKRLHPKAILTNPDCTRVIFLLGNDRRNITSLR